MQLKSWKTTLGGILLGVGQWASTQSTPWWLYKVGGILAPIGALLLGGAARDNNVPSAAVPAAAKAEEKIKGDTKPPFPITLFIGAIAIALCGCNSVHITDPSGGPSFRATMVAWPWQDSSRIMERMNISAKTNGTFTASIRGLSETETTSTNIENIVEAVTAGAVHGAIRAMPK